MAITAKDVMSLRQRTGMGMMECKKALGEAGGDFDAAVEILRAAAKGKMDERTDRAAAEGTLAVAKSDSAVAMIEINTETDFTARNDSVIEIADKIADQAIEAGEGEVAANDQITALIDEVRLTTKENISYARGVKFSAAAGGKVGSYLHHNRQIGALLVVEGDLDDETLTGLAQHVTAADGMTMPVPLAVDEASLSADAIAEKKAEFVKEAEESGKPAEIAEKMSTGKLRKWVDENTLLGQAYVKDMTGKTKVGDLLGGAKVVKFIRYQVGVK
ncbi:translation elongation factor Ts [Planctomycetales bacterium ZRK34]|nr:translation elongation factor Ts [Planctomycetales bacterium ZRK34]